jgi:hypothetical protein
MAQKNEFSFFWIKKGRAAVRPGQELKARPSVLFFVKLFWLATALIYS